ALGAVGFNLLTMKQPFRGDSDLEMTYNAMHQDPRRPSDATDQPIPPALDDLIVGMMARDQDARPRNVDVVLERLDAMTLATPWNRQLAADWWAAHPLTETHAANADRRTGLGPLRVEVN
ncbi:MAG: hypothetical protein ACR2QJ_03640, partial [Geminicoccaceae bacterium]